MIKTYITNKHNNHIRVLSGPGTGKTENLIKTVIQLLENGSDPKTILVVTFTRAAANELQDRILKNENLDESNIPIIKNLHAYSLMILMSDAYRSRINLPLRILDDWEEETFLIKIFMYLFKKHGSKGKKIIEDKLNYYEAGWNRLTFDHNEWIREEDIDFDITLSSLKHAFGFTLRGELNYKLKEYFDSDPIALKELNLNCVLIDEYQDLNPCEHSIIQHFKNSGAQILCFGDDDQSIYSFRQAAPSGIIDFDKYFNPCTDYPLNNCYRCHQNLLKFARNLIVSSTYNRIDKNIISTKSGNCVIKCFQFAEGDSELYGIKIIIKILIDSKKLDYKDILILVPSKTYGYRCAKTLKEEKIPLEDWLTIKNPLKFKNLRKLYALIRLIIDSNDAIAKWTWLKLSYGISDNTLNKVVHFALDNKMTFNDVIANILENKSILDNRSRNSIIKASNEMMQLSDSINKFDTISDFFAFIKRCKNFDFNEEELEFLENQIDEDSDESEEVLSIIFRKFINYRLEPELTPTDDKIRIMTMHKAKGLSSKAIIIPFQEDEVMLSRICDDDLVSIEERRRLFYVSITRAKEFLFITHSRQRIRNDAYTSDGKIRNRVRSRFLNDMKIKSENGEEFIKKYQNYHEKIQSSQM